MIILKDITKKFRNTTAVKGLSVEIREGELVCLLGPSGCGKSTTLSMIAGLEPPTKGDIFFDGKSEPGGGRGQGHRYGIPELCPVSPYDGRPEY